jgi:hypothetical protein
MTEHPIKAAKSKGRSLDIFKTAPSGMTLKLENAETPAK